MFHYHASCVSLKAVPLLVYRPDIREPMTAVLPVVRARRSGLDTKVGLLVPGQRSDLVSSASALTSAIFHLFSPMPNPYDNLLQMC